MGKSPIRTNRRLPKPNETMMLWVFILASITCCWCQKMEVVGNRLCFKRDIPSGFQFVPGTDRVIRYFREERTWDEAKKICGNNNGAKLLTIDGKRIEDWVIPLTKDKETWTGYNDKAQEKTWVWESGKPTKYTNWLPNEPNNYNNGDSENCAVVCGKG